MTPLHHYLGAPQYSVPEGVLALAHAAAEQAPTFEAQRQISADFARAMARADLFRMFVPAALGGPEMPLSTGLGCLETLSSHDAAVGWLSMIGTTSALAAHFMPPDLAREIFSGPVEGAADGREASAIYGGIFAPNGRAHCLPGDAGYQLSGRWSWASGSANADWMVLGALLGTHQESDDADRQLRFFAVRRDQLTIHDTWHALGLNATSSGDVSVEAAIIPQSHCLDLMSAQPHTASAVGSLPYFGVLALGIGACALGNALGCCIAFEAEARQGRLAGQSRIQADYGVALGSFLAARSFYWHSVEALWAQASAANAAGSTPSSPAPQPIISPEDRAIIRLAATQAVRASLSTVRTLHDLLGGRAVYRDFVFQKHLRDAETMSQHMMTALPSYMLAGRVWLGGYRPDLQL